MKKLASGIGLLACLMATAASAQGYNYSYGLTSPGTVVAGRQATSTLTFNLDTTKPPAGFLYDTGTVSGQISLGNGKISGYNFSVFSAAGSSTSVSRAFTTTYKIPGTYYAGGDFRFVQQAVFEGGTSGANDFFRLSNNPINVIKDPAEVARHRQRANDAKLSLATLDLFNALSGFGASIKEAAGSLVGQWIGSKNNSAGDLLSTLVGLGLGVASGSPVGFAIASTYALMTTYYQVVVATETRLANDPPDPNYQEVYAYTNSSSNVVTGLGSGQDMFLNAGITDIARLLEAKRGQLASLERGQAALLAGDFTALQLQSDALDKFTADELRLRTPAGEFISQLPGFLDANGGTGPGSGELKVAFAETGDQLITAPVPEPSTYLMMGFGLLAAGAVARRKRSRKALVARPDGYAFSV
ncbi:PEP-CTERM sorting domain-containing protein [Sphingomonas aerophila]|uniref:Ice-binding protein C-terminal domain-containing protein n=1 Tax=Sphingomonas aerophila TaxID=1344948 RepID=A0A7W9BET7_9SPHN|nr:PEP-CTERM sorting domain-containing protein [Sphingomonas aerophila]MBB5715863.1 hypothetical protein [Sphingomonas aerophila]